MATKKSTRFEPARMPADGVSVSVWTYAFAGPRPGEFDELGSNSNFEVTYRGTPEALIASGVATPAMASPGQPGRKRLDPNGNRMSFRRTPDGVVIVRKCDGMERALALPRVSQQLVDEALSEARATRADWMRRNAERNEELQQLERLSKSERRRIFEDFIARMRGNISAFVSAACSQAGNQVRATEDLWEVAQSIVNRMNDELERALLAVPLAEDEPARSPTHLRLVINNVQKVSRG